MNIYQQKGFEGRKDYIEQVALTYGLNYDDVAITAIMLGANEDFDGLLSSCADMAGTCFMYEYELKMNPKEERLILDYKHKCSSLYGKFMVNQSIEN